MIYEIEFRGFRVSGSAFTLEASTQVVRGFWFRLLGLRVQAPAVVILIGLGLLEVLLLSATAAKKTPLEGCVDCATPPS